MALNKRQYVDGQTIVTASNLNEIQDCIITIEGSYVPKTRKVAGKALTSDITLSAGDVGAVPTSRTINAKALTGNITLSAADVGAVPVARTVNSKALSSNITLNASDVGAVPTTRKVNNKALSADISLTASDVGAVPTSRTVNGKALSANITLASSDIGDDSGAGGTNVKASLAALNGAINAITPLDTTPTSGSTKGITSGAVYESTEYKVGDTIPIGGLWFGLTNGAGAIVSLIIYTAKKLPAGDNVVFSVSNAPSWVRGNGAHINQNELTVINVVRQSDYSIAIGLGYANSKIPALRVACAEFNTASYITIS